MKYNAGHGVQMDPDHGKAKIGMFGPGGHPSTYLPPVGPRPKRVGPGKAHGIGLDR